MNNLVYLKDPVCIKEALSIALELLPDNKYCQLKESVALIPSIVGCTNWEIPEELKEDLIRCIKEFKPSKTYLWLREDFKNELYDMEIQLNRKIS